MTFFSRAGPKLELRENIQELQSNLRTHQVETRNWGAQEALYGVLPLSWSSREEDYPSLNEQARSAQPYVQTPSEYDDSGCGQKSRAGMKFIDIEYMTLKRKVDTFLCTMLLSQVVHHIVHSPASTPTSLHVHIHAHSHPCIPPMPKTPVQ